MLEIRALSRPGVENFDLDLADGEAVALLGPSGSGKTLLLRSIADLDPNAGRVRLDGLARESVPAPEWRRRVTYLAAEPGWWAERAKAHFPDPTAVVPMLRTLGLPIDILEQRIATLSTGERHRIALVRVLIQEPRVLLLDEPTGGLDQATTGRVERILRARLDRGTAILFTTHDEALAARLARRSLRIEHGRLRSVAL